MPLRSPTRQQAAAPWVAPATPQHNCSRGAAVPNDDIGVVFIRRAECADEALVPERRCDTNESIRVSRYPKSTREPFALT
jgi:hypothetical protein